MNQSHITNQFLDGNYIRLRCKEPYATAGREKDGLKGKGSVQILTCLVSDTPFLSCLDSEVVLICCVMYRCQCCNVVWRQMCAKFNNP